MPLSLISYTAQYTNAVLVAILPHISDFAAKLKLPIDLPLTTNSVQRYNCMTLLGNVGGGVYLTNGYYFRYDFGHVYSFQQPHSYYHINSFSDLPLLYGKVNISEDEALSTARGALESLGYNLKDIYADQPPEVEAPPTISGNVIPVYRFRWRNPLEASHLSRAIEIVVDADKNRIQEMALTTRLFNRPPPKIDSPRNLLPREQFDYQLSNSESNDLVRVLLPRISDFANILQLPVKTPVAASDIENFATVSPVSGKVRLKNNFRFTFYDGRIEGFDEPDSVYLHDLWTSQLPISAYVGQWNLSPADAMKVVLGTLARLGYSTNDIKLTCDPFDSAAAKAANFVIPRYRLHWEHEVPDDWRHVEAEIDGSSGAFKSLSFTLPSH